MSEGEEKTPPEMIYPALDVAKSRQGLSTTLGIKRV